jgi:hypothetical protein
MERQERIASHRDGHGAVLIFRSFQRRRELAHHRLYDAIGIGLRGAESGGYFKGQRPEGRVFDEDSVGAEEAEFYYAEDMCAGIWLFSNETVTASVPWSNFRRRRTMQCEFLS